MAATGFTPISLYYSATPTNVPLAANLVAGELALNTADGKLYFKNSSNVVRVLSSAGTGAIGGTTTQVQYNLSGALAGSANMTFDGTTLTSAFTGPHNGTVGATTPNTGAFTDLSYTGTLTGSTGVVNIGSGQVYKDASGNVGIGTSSPGAKLDVQGVNVIARVKSTSGIYALFDVDSPAAQQAIIRFLANGVEQARILSVANEGASQLAFSTGPGSTERMRIDSIGNIGIGTNSPSQKLNVVGNILATGTITSSSDERLKDNWAALPADFVEQLADVKHGTYTRTDSGDRQVGVSAQSLQRLLPEAVQGGEYLSVAYGNAALVACVQLSKRVVEQDERIAKLEAIVAKLTKGT